MTMPGGTSWAGDERRTGEDRRGTAGGGDRRTGSGPDPRFRLFETESWVGFLNTNQGLLGRCYLMLKRPETDVTALTDAELAELWAAARRVKAALSALWEPDHYNYAFLMNETPQVHFHVIPRYQGRREFAGGTFVDPEFGGHYGTGPARTLETDAYDAVLSALRGKL